jgi:hypothetical protein
MLCKPGGCFFSNKLKWPNGWKICLVFNYCTKFQTICLTIHFSLKNQPFAVIMPLPNLHIADICILLKLGKGINLSMQKADFLGKNVSLRALLKGLN